MTGSITGEAGKGNALVKEIMRMLKEGEMP